MATKEFTAFPAAGEAKNTDVLLMHDGNGVKTVTVETLEKSILTEEEILLQIVNHTYQGTDLTVKFADEIANYSDEWAWVQARLDSDNLTGLHIGDYIPITAMGEDHIAQIAGINTYLNTGDDGYIVKTHIDWISKDCLSQTVQFNTSNNNNGNATQGNPFLASNLHSWLVGTVYPTLDAKLKAVIKDKRLLAPTRYAASGALSDDNSWAWASFDKLWVPLEGEIMDHTIFSTKGYGDGHAVQYPIFADSWESRIKGVGPGGSRAYWWEASAVSGNATYVCIVYNGGFADNYYASSARHAPVCFRTMAAA